MRVKIYQFATNEKNKKISVIKTMNIEKSNINRIRFIENTQRIMNATNSVLGRLMEEDSHIRAGYSDVPALLEMGKGLLVNLDDYTSRNVIKSFLEKSAPVWEKIKNKDITILSENLDTILPQNPFIPRIQYLYGSNPYSRCYVNERETANMWKLIEALIHNSVKFAMFLNDQELLSLLPSNAVQMWKINLN